MLEKIKAKTRDFKIYLSALTLAYRRNDVSIIAKILIIVTVGYALSPIDLIPDFIPVIGYLGDLIIIPFLIFLILKIIPKEIMDECKEQAKDLWKNGKPKKWYYTIPIVLVWLMIIFIIVKNIYSKISIKI
jgi:uncharacterized membrane protein YkvA (DUF1232 family)